MQESPFGPKPYLDPKESARVRANRAQSFADGVLSAIRGAVKSVTTDLPGLVLDAVDKLAGDTKTFGEKDRSEQMFSAVTGTKKGDSTTEMLGSFVNPIAATQAMIVPALLTKELATVRKAAKALDSGATDEQVQKVLGVIAGPNARADGILRDYISDQGARLRYTDENPLGVRKGVNEFASDGPELWMDFPFVKEKRTLEDVLDHPELFKVVPQLKSIEVGNANPKSAFYNKDLNYIGVGSFKSPEDFLDAVLHETQHGVQNLFGMLRGGNSNMFIADPLRKQQAIRDINNLSQEVTAAASIKAKEVGSSLYYKPSEELKQSAEFKQFTALNEARDRLFRLDEEAYDSYRLIGGEAEAFGQEALRRGTVKNPLDIYRDPKTGSFLDIIADPLAAKKLDEDPVIKAIFSFIENKKIVNKAKDSAP